MLDIAAFQEFAVVALLVQGRAPRHVIHEAIRRHGTVPAGDVMFELICIAGDMRRGHQADRARSDALFRACALLAADIHAVGADRMQAVTCADVARHWGPHESFFVADPG
jgi:hypothetical protein